MPEPFSHRLRVRYNECDQLGIVFNANYLVYTDVAINELWRDRLGGYSSMMDSGLDLAVVESLLKYRTPLRFDDEFDATVSIEHIGTKSMKAKIVMTRGDEVTAEVDMTYVCVDQATGESRPIPDSIRSGLS